MLAAAVIATAAGIAGALLVAGEWFAAGAALLALSVLALRWPQSIWDGGRPAGADGAAATNWAALAAVLAVALFFRVYRLNPPGLWGDDAINGLLAFDILDGRVTSPLQLVSHAHSTFHALSNYPIAAAFWAFGADLTTLRLPGSIASLLCVPLLYGIAAPLFGARVALLAALFFASSPPQITHGKQLIQIILGELFQLAGLCLLVRGLVTRRRWQIAAAGLPFALCCYTYHAARLAPLIGLIYGLAVLRAQRRAGARHAGGDRPIAIALGWTAVVFLLAIAPAADGWARNPSSLVGRVGATSLWPAIQASGDLWPLWDSVWRTLLMFHYQQGPEYHWFGLGFDPALNAVLAFLVVHGLVESLRRWREPRHLLLLGWLLVGLLPGFLSTGAPRLYRSLLATPPLYVWAALPLARLLAWPRASGAAAPRRAAAVAGLALLLAAAVPLVDFNYYFYRVYTHPAFHWFQGARMVEIARTLRRYGPGWTGYLMTDTYGAQHESLVFLARAWNLTLRDVASLADVVPLPELPAAGALFIASEATLGAVPAIAARYPGGELRRRHEPRLRSWGLHDWWPLDTWGERPRMTLAFYPVPRAVAERPTDRPRGLVAEYDGDPPLRRDEPYPFYAFFPPTRPATFSVRWSGRLEVPEPGGFRLHVEANGRPTLRVDGQRQSPSTGIAAGTHDVTLVIRDVPGRARLRISWAGRGAAQELVPPHAWSPR